jgi:hypothetical protein
MKTLRMLTVGTLFAAVTAAVAATAEESSIPTITITAKRHAALPAAERVPPEAHVPVTVILPTDMPEAEIDFHVTPVASLPAGERTTS